MHLRQRRHVTGVAEVVGVTAARQAGARGRLHGDDADLSAAAKLRPDEWKRDAREVRAAAGAADDDVGIVIGHVHLRDGFLADDGLVQQHVIEHRTERVIGVVSAAGDLHRLGDRDAEAAVAVGRRREHLTAEVGFHRRARDAACAERLHERATIRFLVVRHPHHEHLDLDAEERAGERERRSPLPRAGLGRDFPDAGLLVVERLRHGGVRLVAACGTHAFVLVINARGSLERLFQTPRPVQRARAPLLVRVADRLGNLHLPLGRHLLHDQRHGEQRREVVGSYRLERPRMQHRRRGDGRSATRLYQCFGMRASSSTYLTLSLTVPPRASPALAGPGILRTIAPLEGAR